MPGWSCPWWASASVSILFLGGCVAAAIPPAVTVLGYGADGASYAVSGKSITDHAISGVADQDCALVRVVEGEEVCLAYEDSDTARVAPQPESQSEDWPFRPPPGSEASASISSDWPFRPPPSAESSGPVSPDWPFRPPAGSVY